MIVPSVSAWRRRSAIVTLGPLEGITILLMVCTITGLVLVSPWVFYQIWAFVAAGLYRHERHYVMKFLPFSLGLFLAGVFLCFFGVLPVTLQIPAGVQRLARHRADPAALGVDELRDDPPARLRPLLPDAPGDALPRADRHLHGRRLPGEAEVSPS